MPKFIVYNEECFKETHQQLIDKEDEDDSHTLRSATIELEEGMTIVVEPYCYTNIRIRRA